MRSALKTISGLAMLVGIWVLVWSLTGQPPLNASRIGSGLQAIGAAIELYAIAVIVWEPLVRPCFAKATDRIWAAFLNLRRKLHQRFPKLFPPIRHKVDLAAELSATGSLSASGTLIRGGTTEERLERLEEDFEVEQNRTAQRFEEVAKKGAAALDAHVAAMESKALRVRTEDAVRLLLGVSVALVGAAWASVG